MLRTVSAPQFDFEVIVRMHVRLKPLKQQVIVITGASSGIGLVHRTHGGEALRPCRTDRPES